MWTALCLACQSCLTSSAGASRAAQDVAARTLITAGAAVRVRIRNTDLGAVEASSDAGRTWRLIARIGRPAVEAAPDEAARAPGVLRSSADAVILALGAGLRLRLLPAKSTGTPRDVATLDPPSALSTLHALLPVGGTSIALETQGRPTPLHDGYTPADGDVLVLLATAAGDDLGRAAQAIAGAARAYTANALARLRSSGRKPVSGALTVVARPAPGEDPGSVTFLLDGVPVALINRAPYSVRWDSSDWSDGEHLIEARIIGPTGAVSSRTKQLIFVQNGSPDG